MAGRDVSAQVCLDWGIGSAEVRLSNSPRYLHGTREPDRKLLLEPSEKEARVLIDMAVGHNFQQQVLVCLSIYQGSILDPIF